MRGARIGLVLLLLATGAAAQEGDAPPDAQEPPADVEEAPADAEQPPPAPVVLETPSDLVLLQLTVVIDGQPSEGRLSPGAQLVIHTEPVPLVELPEGAPRMPRRDRCLPARQLVLTLELVGHGQAVYDMALRNDAGEFRCEPTDTYGEVWTTPQISAMIGATATVRQTREDAAGYDQLMIEITSEQVGSFVPVTAD